MTLKVPVVWISWLSASLLAADVCMAQKIPSKPLPTDPQESQEESIQPRKPDTFSLGAQSMAESMLDGTRHHIGFTLGVYGAYTSNVFASYQQRRDSVFSSFVPRVFINLGKRKSQLHVSFGGGYRLYNGHRDLDSADYYGNARYSLALSKRTTLQITDRMSSSKNDAGSFVYAPIFAPIAASSGSYYDILLSRQRVTRNAMAASLNFQVGKKHNFGVFTGYDSYRYQVDSPVNANVIEVGGDYRVNLTKWLVLSNSYATYLTNVDERFRDARIHRLEAGGLDFRLSRTWRFWASGGVEVSQYQGVNRVGPSATASVFHMSRKAAVNIMYHKGFASAVGLSRVLNSDNFNARMGYRVTSWILATLQAAYYRSSEQSGAGILRTLWGGGGFEFALVNGLVASVNYSYQNQKAQYFTTSTQLGLNRYVARLGLQYFWPSSGR